jgi:RNA ligase (TIGR02306 family)
MSELLVAVCKVDKIEKHPNADRLSIVTVKGWHCIVGLNQYKEGDLVVYCPPDAIIPQDIIDKYKLEFLRKNGRVGTIKLRQVISQGLVLDIPKPMGNSWPEGLNVATMLGITKWEPPEEPVVNNGTQVSKKKLNPNFDVYTDIQNIKHFPNLFEDGEDIVVTEKIHGTNFRAGNLKRANRNIFQKLFNKIFGEYEFVYGSHNVQKRPISFKRGFYKEDVYGKIVRELQLDKIIPKDYIVYGEIYGDGIQDLTYGLKGCIDVRFFDIKYKGKYLNYPDFLNFCHSYGLKPVPVLFGGKYTVDTVNKLVDGQSLLDPKQMREGCVVRPVEEKEVTRIDHIGRKILKCISVEYLLRKDGTEKH